MARYPWHFKCALRVVNAGVRDKVSFGRSCLLIACEADTKCAIIACKLVSRNDSEVNKGTVIAVSGYPSGLAWLCHSAHMSVIDLLTRNDLSQACT